MLGPDLVGAYLFGSGTLGGLKPESDLDVFAVSRRRTSLEQKRTLVRRLLALSGRPRPLELTIVVQSEVRPWRYPPRLDFQYGDWWRSEFERGDLEPWATPENPDLATLITMVLLADRPLLGPPAAEVLDPVPPADRARAMADSVDALLDDLDSDTRNVLLTLARIWSTLATGEIRSKDAAADWALARLPADRRAVLAQARDAYRGEQEERWDGLAPLVRLHAKYVVREIRRLAAVASGA